MNNPVVSIVIPTFNRADSLIETISSIQKQIYPYWEAIIVDDGSTDGSLEMLERINKKDNRVQYYLRKDISSSKGAPICRNIGLEYSSGTYVIFLDSDDLLMADCLGERVKNFEQNYEKDFLVFPGAFFKEKIEDSNLLWNKFTAENDLNRFLRGDVVWQTSGPIWKRLFLVENNYSFNENAKSSQDWEFHINILLNKPNFLKINTTPDYFVRRNTEDNTRISDGHYSLIKFKNRVPLIEEALGKISENEHFSSLHKYLVRDTISCMRREEKRSYLELFEKVNEKFPSHIRRNWTVLIKLAYFTLGYDLHIFFRLIHRFIDLYRPGYFRGFKMNYRSKY